MKRGLTPYRPEIEFAAQGERLDPNLVEAIVLTESSGRTSAYRYEPGFYKRYIEGKPAYAGMVPQRIAASYGLMQCMVSTAEQYGFNPRVVEPEELFKPLVGLKYGCRHLRHLLQWSGGDLEKALGAYNAGKPNWDSDKAREYRAKVLKWLEKVREAQK